MPRNVRTTKLLTPREAQWVREVALGRDPREAAAPGGSAVKQTMWMSRFTAKRTVREALLVELGLEGRWVEVERWTRVFRALATQAALAAGAKSGVVADRRPNGEIRRREAPVREAVVESAGDAPWSRSSAASTGAAEIKDRIRGVALSIGQEGDPQDGPLPGGEEGAVSGGS